MADRMVGFFCAFIFHVDQRFSGSIGHPQHPRGELQVCEPRYASPVNKFQLGIVILHESFLESAPVFVKVVGLGRVATIQRRLGFDGDSELGIVGTVHVSKLRVSAVVRVTVRGVEQSVCKLRMCVCVIFLEMAACRV